MSTKQLTVLLLLITLLVLPLTNASAVPPEINYQGFLTDPAGIPITTPPGMGLIVVFSIYDVDEDGTALWSEQQAIEVSNGIYSVALGQVTPINLLFDVPYFLGVKIGDDSEMTPRQPLTSVGYSKTSDYADSSGDADTVDGRHAGELDQAAHTLDTGNPHDITVAQIGAVSSANFTNHMINASAHHARYSDSDALNAVIDNDGAGSGVDADRLDGFDSAYFAPYYGVMPIILNNDGHGSGVDADTVDGKHASEITGQSYQALEAKLNALETALCTNLITTYDSYWGYNSAMASHCCNNYSGYYNSNFCSGYFSYFGYYGYYGYYGVNLLELEQNDAYNRTYARVVNWIDDIFLN